MAAGSQERFCLGSVVRAKGLCCGSGTRAGSCAVPTKWSWDPVTWSAGMQVDPWVLRALQTISTAACLVQVERRRFSKHPWDHSPTSASTDFAASNSSYLKCH